MPSAARAWSERCHRSSRRIAVISKDKSLEDPRRRALLLVFVLGLGAGARGGAFLGTEAASALVLYAAKLVTFGHFGILTTALVLRGLVIGAALTSGPFLTR